MAISLLLGKVPALELAGACSTAWFEVKLDGTPNG
jgi:hypothetical protein